MKSLLCGLLSICMTVGLFAQDDTEMAVDYPDKNDNEMSVDYPVKGDTEIGVLFGVFNSYISEDGFFPSDNSTYVYNVGFGLHYDYYFSKTWSLKARLNYDPRGFKEELTDITLNATYLSIPVMANWHFGKRKRWYLHFGPYAAVLLSADVDGVDVKDAMDSTEIGMDLGIGVKIPIGKLMFFIENDGQNDFTSSTAGNDDKFVRSALTLGLIF